MNIRKKRRWLVACIILSVGCLICVGRTVPAQAADRVSNLFSDAGRTVTVVGRYKNMKATRQVKKTNPASMEVNPEQDYIHILKMADLGGGLKMKVADRDDYMNVRQSETAHARLKNETAIRNAKAAKIDRKRIARARKQAEMQAKKKYQNVWELPSRSMALPSGTDGAVKTYMDYTAVTNRNSSQYQLLHSQKAYTRKGFRMYDGYYCVAMGSYYSRQIGTKFYVTLSNGRTLRCILGDQKSDRHTNETHQYAKKNKDILEFIVDGMSLSGGDISEIEGFEGSITSIQSITDAHTTTLPYGTDSF